MISVYKKIWVQINVCQSGVKLIYVLLSVITVILYFKIVLHTWEVITKLIDVSYNINYFVRCSQGIVNLCNMFALFLQKGVEHILTTRYGNTSLLKYWLCKVGCFDWRPLDGYPFPSPEAYNVNRAPVVWLNILSVTEHMVWWCNKTVLTLYQARLMLYQLWTHDPTPTDDVSW